MARGVKLPVITAPKFGRMCVGDLIDYWLVNRGMTQKELAEKVGFPRPNFVSMIVKGHAKLPLERVKATADALGISSTYLMRLVLGEDHPELLKVMEEVFGHMVTGNEFAIISHIREVSGYSDPGLGGKDTKRLLKEAFGR
jgi:transcriptional regulator with XRE-family HTH domain